jgi:hypothetical protein
MAANFENVSRHRSPAVVVILNPKYYDTHRSGWLFPIRGYATILQAQHSRMTPTHDPFRRILLAQ